MKIEKRLAGTFLAAAMLAAALSGCSGGGTAAASGGDDTVAAADSGLTQVRWVSPSALATFDYSWMYVAQEMGYFADEGLEVELIENIDGSDARYLAAGSADFGGSSPGVALSSVDVGATNIQAVVNQVSSNIFGFAYSEESGIQGWDDLAGKRIAISAESMTSIYNPILEAAGVDTATIEYVVFSNARYEALQSGTVDAMATWIPEYEMCLGMGYSGWGFLSGNDVLPQIANSVWVNTDFAAENPEAVEGFARAVTRAIYFCYCNPEAAADITFNYYPSIDCTWEGAVGAVNGNVQGMVGLTEEDQLARIEAHTIGVFDMDIVQQTMDNLLSGGSIRTALAAEDYYTNEYVDTAWDYAEVEADADAYECTSSVYLAQE